MKRMVIGILFLSCFLFVAGAQELTQFGRCRALTDAQIGNLFSEAMINSSSDFKKQLFAALSDEYTSKGCSNPVYFEVTESGKMGILSKNDANKKTYFILFPPESKWRFFDPDNGITFKSVTANDYKEMLIAELSGGVVVISKNKKSALYEFVTYTQAN